MGHGLHPIKQMRIKNWSVALVALTLVAPACSENALVGPTAVTVSPRTVHVPGLPDVRISEIHYDDASFDDNEFIEVSGPAGTDLTGWRIVLYNGSATDRGPYGATGPRALSGLIPDQCDGRGVVVLTYPRDGIQNGAPDAIALVDAANHVVEFLSYEGSFTAVGTVAEATPVNPAAGLTSTDIGVLENGVPEGQSISRSGTGPNAWNGPAAATMGTCNDDQEPPPPPPPVVIPDTRFNEVHYDNVGFDGNEKLEIRGPAGTDFTGWSVVLYNGSGGVPYNTTSLTGVIPTVCEDRVLVVVGYAQDGLQNGPDGFALVNATGELVEFLSYEGSFTATSGPAAGKTSTDIGVSELGSSPIGHSLQRNADGKTWEPAGPASFGLCTGTALFGVVTFTGREAFENPPLPVGFEDQLFGSARDPNNTPLETTFSWTSETPAIADVDEDGVVRALAAGTAIIRATTADGSASGTFALPTHVAVASPTAIYEGNAEFGEPTDANRSDDFIVRRPQLISSFNRTKGIPNWVAFEMEASHVGPEDRCECYTFDPALTPGFSSYTTADYTGGSAFHGYAIDRGHLARSTDRSAGSLDNAVTYYFSNIIPQAQANNQGPWGLLETHLGNLVRFENKEVYVIAGASGSLGTLKNEGKITIPENVWKVAVIMPRDQGIESVRDLDDIEIVAVIMPNVDGIRNDAWQKYQTTVNAVEALSGYDLLALLKNDIEAEVESGLQGAILELRRLVAAGTIPKNKSNVLETKLDVAVKHLEHGRIQPAVNQLETLLHKLDELVESGRVTEAQVSALREMVVALIGSVSS